MSFADLKKKSGSFEKLQAELEKVNNPVTSFADDRFWKPELDKSVVMVMQYSIPSATHW